MAKQKKNKLMVNILEDNKQNKQFNYIDTFRHIRTNIEYSNVDNPVKSVVITSTQANESKTTTAINLAFIYAMKYKKVLLIDCDLRKHQLNQYLNLPNRVGITDLIVEFSKTGKINQEMIQEVSDQTFVSPLSVISGGKTVPNSTEFLGSKLFKVFLDEMKKQYDFIIIDTPPVGVLADAVPVGNMVDGALFVVSSIETDKRDALHCIELLQSNNVKVLGTVLTRAQVNHKGYGYGYGNGYGYGYY